ncbi:Type I secretion C-terminal target domain-containing protein [Pseudomonas sp. IT-P258]|uniref:BapA/Bap/LapF family large adhesin n=1 Tax=Pseudomonas sp. IT-P258 TaxID=3026447 RepID=UPI0039E1D7B0
MPTLSQQFTVTDENTGILNLSFGSGDLVSVLGSGFTATLEVSDGAGGWTPVDQGGVDGGLLDLLGLFGSGNTSAKIDGLAAGQYRFTLSMDPALVAVGATATAQLSVDNESLVDFNVTGGEVSGNVITDEGLTGVPDSPGAAADASVEEVNGIVVGTDPAIGTVVHGLYGDLTIFANGDYSYTPNGDAANVGKVDTFAYQLGTAAGGTASAILYVRIDSTDTTVIWSPTDPSVPGVVEVVATDDIGATLIDRDNLVETENLTAISYSPPALFGTQTGTGQSFVVDADTTAELFVSRSFAGVGVLPTTTIVLQKWDGTTWNEVPGESTTASTHTFTLGEGQYRVTSTTGALATLGTITVAQTLTTTHLTEFVTGAAIAATGNILALSAHSAADSLGSTLTVLSVLINGVYVTPGQTGAVVQGQYGTLTLHADGDYSYTPTPGLALADLGKVDSFIYKLTTPGGQEDTATLYVRLDSPDLDLVWDDANPGNPATEAPGFAAASFEQEPSSATITEGADGADQIAIHDTEFATVDGGAGFDTLLWDGGDATINLSLLVGKVSNIESIDLNDFSAVDLTVSLEDLLAVTAPETDRLFIQGDEQDSVHLTGNWSEGTTQLENGQEYVVYTSQEDETHQLWVQSGVNVV